MNNYCLVADLLGFSNLMLNLQPVLQKERVGKWINLVQQSAEEAKITQYQLVSDTIFAIAPDTDEGLNQLITMSQTLLFEGTKEAFPIRGAIALGDIEYGTITFGRPIVDAYRLANEQVWVGIALHESVKRFQCDWNKIVVYPVPMKTGSVILRPAVVWGIPKYTDFVKALTTDGLSKAGDVLTWEWLNKVQNTLLFGMYVRTHSTYRDSISPHQYRGIAPIEIFERMSRGEQIFVENGGTIVSRLTLGCPREDCRTINLPKLKDIGQR